MVPANETHLYVRPQNQDEQLWNEAVRKNPDPKW
jgi:nuclear pore complex protein Nup54